MTKEQIERGKAIQGQINEIGSNLVNLNTAEKVYRPNANKIYFGGYSNNQAIVPENIQDVIFLLIRTEYQKQIKALEEEFAKL